MSLDLGHVRSGQDHHEPRGNRNGPARQRRREKRAAAQAEKLAAENVGEAENSTTEEVVEEAETFATEVPLEEAKTPAPEEAVGTKTAGKAKSDPKEESTEKVNVKDAEVEDVFCPDALYKKPEQMKIFVSAGTQTLECGVRPTTTTKSGFDFYTLTYDDYETDSN